MAFVTLTCNTCGDEFGAHPSASAAANGYCSPHCGTEGKGL